MKKRKSKLILNIAIICLCISAIAIGVYSAKNASFNVTGTIGFEAHNVKFSVSAIVNCANNSTGDATLTDTNIAEKTYDATSSSANNFAYDVGTLRFNDAIDGGNVITISLTITNLSSYGLTTSMSALPTLVNGETELSGLTSSVAIDSNVIEANKKIIIGEKSSKTFIISLVIDPVVLDDADTFVGNLKMNLTLTKSTKLPAEQAMIFEKIEGTTNAKLVAIGNWADEEKIEIPEYVTINGEKLKVTELANGALGDSFGYANFIEEQESITITEEMWNQEKDGEELGGWHWQKTSYTKVILPSTIETVNAFAFAFSNLTSIEISTGVSTIGMGSFVNCKSLSSIKFPSNTSWQIVLDNSAVDLTIDENNLLADDQLSKIKTMSDSWSGYPITKKSV